MKLSRTAWNNVIIISVMAMILLINLTNNKLFPDTSEASTNDSGEQLVLSDHAVILTLTVANKFIIERVGQSWRIEFSESSAAITPQAIEQMMLAWQKSAGLLQAGDIEISGQTAIEVSITLAGQQDAKRLMVYPLADQLLINNTQDSQWIALPIQLYRQLLPATLYP